MHAQRAVPRRRAELAFRHLAAGARRLLGGVLVIAGACAAVFLIMNWLPGDPARQRLSLYTTPAAVAAERSRLGLDRPVLGRLGDWFWHALNGNLGYSWTSGQSVAHTLGQSIGNSAWLVGATLVIAVPILSAVAIACGLRPGGIVDRAVLAVAALTSAFPPFAIGVLLLLVFSAKLGVLPAISSPDPTRPMLDQLDILVLPVVVLSLTLVALLVQVIRAQVITVSRSAYVEAARLRGIGGPALLRRHILPAVAPVLAQLAAITVIVLATETVIVEVVFAYPGIGSLLQSAVAEQDLPVVQGVALVLATLVVVALGLSGALTTMLTPHHGERPR
jgi:peptide/nickel transport system permease protein